MKLILHPATKLQLMAALPDGSGAVIFHGAVGVGKYTAALELGRSLSCRGDEGGVCDYCSQWAAGSYPDLIVVRPEDKASIGVEQIRRLEQTLSLAPYYADSRRLVVIDEAETLTVAAQNALLKLIEEPPERTAIVLVTTSLPALLVTVQSRCRQVYFGPVKTTAIAEHLREMAGLTPAQANRLAALADGAVGRGMSLSLHPELAEAQETLLAQAEALLAPRLYARLIAARELAERKVDLGLVMARLRDRLMYAAMGESKRSALIGLVAVEHCLRQLAANVSPRAALERLVLELP